ncbi:UNVERIFIED_CONTAM: hypothetical protein Sangu_1414100 [Sesamum angustifolium]|uniref:Uncharacterized protein n=1 Tax=Sesamum angustifolium TaxID=2727405 RepID=A0AAW2N7L6_9LAMI
MFKGVPREFFFSNNVCAPNNSCAAVDAHMPVLLVFFSIVSGFLVHSECSLMELEHVGGAVELYCIDLLGEKAEELKHVGGKYNEKRLIRERRLWGL